MDIINFELYLQLIQIIMEEKGRFPAKTDRGRFSIGYVYDEFMKYRQRRVSTSKLYDYAFRLFIEFVGTDSAGIHLIQGRMANGNEPCSPTPRAMPSSASHIAIDGHFR